MARVTGVQEKVHLPIYDAVSVKAEEQLRKEQNSSTLKFFVDVQEKTKLETNLQLRYENFSTDDWALQGVAPDTLPTILTLGAEPYDDEVWMLGIGFRYLLGER